MTPRAAICKAIEAHECAIATHECALADLRAALAALDGAPDARQETTWIETGVAAKLAGVDPETIRRWAVKHGSGYQTETKKWLHDRAAVLRIAREERTARAGNAARDAANAARAGIQLSAKQAHVDHADEDEK